jgi:3'(2'), 5'-bisphosphate nucleotidase
VSLELDALLTPVAAIARSAGERILEIYNSDFEVTAKSDASPLTAADLAAHRTIVTELQALTPAIPILSEESAAIDYAERRTWSRYWLVDPLDGTREFVKRNGEFTVNIALIDQHEPVLGVVLIPVQNRCYYAAEGVGAFCRDDAGPARAIRVTLPCGDPIRVVGSRSHASTEQHQFVERLGAHELIAIGSSLKFCLIAEGRADVYPRFGPTSEWDTAAAQCIVEQAGGRVVTLNDERLLYNCKESLLNPHFLVYADAARNWLSYLPEQ